MKTLLESLDGPDYEFDDIVFTNTKSSVEQLIDESELFPYVKRAPIDRIPQEVTIHCFMIICWLVKSLNLSERLSIRCYPFCMN